MRKINCKINTNINVDMRFLSPNRISPSNSFLVQSAPISRVPSLEPLFKKESNNVTNHKKEPPDPTEDVPNHAKENKEKQRKHKESKENENKRKISTKNIGKLPYEILEEKEDEQEDNEEQVTEQLI